MKPCRGCSQVTQFSGDTETFPPQECFTLSCLVYHPKFAHDNSYLLGTEKLIVLLALPIPACAPANLLPSSSLFSLPAHCNNDTLQMFTFCSKSCWPIFHKEWWEWSEERRGWTWAVEYRIFQNMIFQTYWCSVLLCVCLGSCSPQESIYIAIGLTQVQSDSW